MARTSQTARRSTGSGAVFNQAVVDNPDLDEETAAKLKAIKEGAMLAEIKHVDRKTTDQGTVFFAETVDDVIPEQVDWWTKFALCIVRHMYPQQPRLVAKTCLQVNSQHLKDILKTTIKDFPGVSFQTKEVTIDQPYRVLFHYRQELEAAAYDLECGSEPAQHLGLLCDFINTEFAETIDETENLLEQGLVEYKSMWTIFRPGSIVYARVLGQPRAFKLLSYAYECGLCPGLSLQLQYVDFDGEDFGTRTTSRLIPAFSGTCRIVDMVAHPLKWHADWEDMVQQLIARGRRFEELAGMHFRCYEGTAIDLATDRYHVDGRVVVDTKTFHRLNSNAQYFVDAFPSNESTAFNRRKAMQMGDEDDEAELTDTLELLPDAENKELIPLTDDQSMLANSVVRGFAFSEKKWFEFFVDKLSPVDWNENCFEQLVLPAPQKDLVRALVATHSQKRLDFDDIVKGKGKGLVLVLHGKPGVGKTLTAETVAEYCRRPLYMVSSGDLGIEPEALDARLSRILDMASTWKAVLLIDEGDIFLERRSLHDLKRNALVGTWLRVLEYYEGILFLTSNRVDCFDEAFKSRIHVPLRYGDLSFDSRKRIWKNFLGKMGGETVHMDDEGYDLLARADINGRQIKNVIRTAKSLAQYHGTHLNCAKLQQVIDIQMEFEDELDLRNDTTSGEVNGY